LKQPSITKSQRKALKKKLPDALGGKVYQLNRGNFHRYLGNQEVTSHATKSCIIRREMENMWCCCQL